MNQSFQINNQYEKATHNINSIIKASPVYYMPEKQYDTFVKGIISTNDGIASFTDSIAPAIKSKNRTSD
ncbi:hypothetical protein SGQ44_18140 [Flavobacterium sp. Fl-77]|uniref:Uncharacterized protein n=1 Tax=Flavobacterium flavipigmentatum TaxID=2893884 RepID=A0AAJ2SJM6_9FLAO|nr:MULTISPECIES: hypothetical protein [unclassified Flavobacterium]MDX6184087.1 hypothetical protein [Flavobacterium sp. Fl-33]MDX6187681.1 hypothetical protein [Flavobacterium sp. Fl-77]UFH39199.1 hypothetical protein LNP22_02720 [Flavobacterium sp. F-70]